MDKKLIEDTVDVLWKVWETHPDKETAVKAHTLICKLNKQKHKLQNVERLREHMEHHKESLDKAYFAACFQLTTSA